jgi:hypothetical protein
MPYELVKKLDGKTGSVQYAVRNSNTGKLHGYTSRLKAHNQMRLLYAIEQNDKFKPNIR